MDASSSSSHSGPAPPPDVDNYSTFQANGAADTVQKSSPGVTLNSAWILDSGAAVHMVNNLNLLTSDVRRSTAMIRVANGELAPASHIGSVELLPDLVLYNVLYGPSFAFNLISVSKLTATSSCSVTFSGGRCVIETLDTHNVIATITSDKVDGLYRISGSKLYDDDVDLWHMRLGHPSQSALNALQSVIPVIGVQLPKECPLCPSAKNVSVACRVVGKTVREVIHCGVRKLSNSLMTGLPYIFIIVDDFSGYSCTYFMKDKSKSVRLLQSFCESEFRTSVVKMVVSDNSAEFYMEEFYKEKGMGMVCVPQENSVVEHKYRDILDVALSLKLQAKLPTPFDGECIVAATHLINRIPSLPSPLLNNKTPYELLLSVPPSYVHLKVVGCACTAVNLDKPEAGKRDCVFLGYTSEGRRYKVYDLLSKTPFFSKDVVFNEKLFPYAIRSSQG